MAPPRKRSPVPVLGAPHGTSSGYGYWKCGCERCLAYNRRARRQWRDRQWEVRAGRRPIPAYVRHQTDNCYIDYGCRLLECVKAYNARWSDRRRRRRDEGRLTK